MAIESDGNDAKRVRSRPRVNVTGAAAGRAGDRLTSCRLPSSAQRGFRRTAAAAGLPSSFLASPAAAGAAAAAGSSTGSRRRSRSGSSLGRALPLPRHADDGSRRPARRGHARDRPARTPGGSGMSDRRFMSLISIADRSISRNSGRSFGRHDHFDVVQQVRHDAALRLHARRSRPRP